MVNFNAQMQCCITKTDSLQVCMGSVLSKNRYRCSAVNRMTKAKYRFYRIDMQCCKLNDKDLFPNNAVLAARRESVIKQPV